MATYSFGDVSATLAAPGASIALGAGSANAEEGITLSFTTDRNMMTIGADGEGMQTKRQDKSGTVTIRLLKTSPTNALLNTAFTAQSVDSAMWGLNVITVSNSQAGDLWACRECAFVRIPDYTYAQDGDTVEWEFHAVKIDPVIGAYNV
jgi:hypothetical protein